jgi:hypothetical protein
MEVSNNWTKKKHIIIGNRNIEIVNQFQYPEPTVTYDNNVNVEISHRITMGNSCYYCG